MKHYVYKTSSPSGRYYIGRHSTKDLNDGYLGSGKWILQMKDTLKLTVEILEFADTFESLLDLEKKYIAEHIDNPDNMNFNNNPVGFAFGHLNWNTTEEARTVKRQQRLGKSFEELYGIDRAALIKEKISLSKTGVSRESAWNSGLDKSEPRIAKIAEHISESISNWMSTLSVTERKEKFGLSGELNGFYGKTHSVETKSQLSEKQRQQRKHNRRTCVHCGKNVDAPNYARYHGDRCKHKSLD